VGLARIFEVQKDCVEVRDFDWVGGIIRRLLNTKKSMLVSNVILVSKPEERTVGGLILAG
jgi:hypothetical protein